MGAARASAGACRHLREEHGVQQGERGKAEDEAKDEHCRGEDERTPAAFAIVREMEARRHDIRLRQCRFSHGSIGTLMKKP